MVHKGTVAAFVATAKALDDPSLPPAGRVVAEIDLRELAGLLDALDFFDVFEIRSPSLSRLVERALVGR